MSADTPKQLSSDFKLTFLRRFSKLTCFSTIFLIFAGGMVTSTGSGLAVPDWPLSYGSFFPPMVGGVFYEHGHRMVASLVGLFMLVLALLLWRWETRKWVKILGFSALGTVIAQGILGGITVKFFLPTPISVAHGVLAQTFLILTVIIAYSQSIERSIRVMSEETSRPGIFVKIIFVFIGLIYLQLLAGAVMRHTGSGLAIPDFPTMGGQWWPSFDAGMMDYINDWRFTQGLDAVTPDQVLYHVLHRLGAILVLVGAVTLTVFGYRYSAAQPILRQTIRTLDLLVLLQVTLGIATILTHKEARITSLHVVTGAVILAWSALLCLRASATKWDAFLKQVNQ